MTEVLTNLAVAYRDASHMFGLNPVVIDPYAFVGTAVLRH